MKSFFRTVRKTFSVKGSMLLACLALLGAAGCQGNEGSAPAGSPSPTAKEAAVETNLALNQNYTLSAPASTPYPDNGNELTDGRRASPDFTDAAWQGHSEGARRTITFDFKQKVSVSRIKTTALQQLDCAIRLPDTIIYSVSDDGQHWATLAKVKSDVSPGNTATMVEPYEWDGGRDGVSQLGANFKMAYTRYVRISFYMQNWTFLDEIEVWGVNGKGQTAGALKADPAGETSDYLRSGKQTGGISNLVLLYNGHYSGGRGDWETNDFLPYVGYVNPQLEAGDTFFDGGLFLALNAPSNRRFVEGDSPSNLEDWQWYLDKTLGDDGDAAHLDQAVQETADRLHQPDLALKVVVMVPYPAPNQLDFGDVDQDGTTEHLGLEPDREKVVKWYVDGLMKRWNDAGFRHLELAGLYWMNETIGNGDRDIVRYTGDLAHHLQLSYYWIPYSGAAGIPAWKDFGFDAAALQPNYFFNDVGKSRISDTADMAKTLGAGVEMEFDDRVFATAAYRQKYIDYLNGGIDSGYAGDVFKAYYQDIRTLGKAAVSTNPEERQIYDWMYQFVRGKYEKQ